MEEFRIYKPGNYVYVSDKSQGNYCGLIDEISEGKYSVTNIKTGVKSICDPDSISGVTISPIHLGFEKIDDLTYRKGNIQLEDKTEVDQEEGAELEFEDMDFITKFLTIGYAVKIVGSETYLYEPNYNNHEEKNLGVTEVHELQNLVPEIDFKLKF